jgi:hypothetical protein
MSIQLLDRDLRRLMIFQNLVDIVSDLIQSRLQQRLAVGAKHARLDQFRIQPVGLNHRITAYLQTRIDPENFHSSLPLSIPAFDAVLMPRHVFEDESFGRQVIANFVGPGPVLRQFGLLAFFG